MEGFWQFAILDPDSKWETHLLPTMLLFDAGSIRCTELPPVMSGDYRINQRTLTCFLCARLPGLHHPPIVQFVGEIEPQRIRLAGTLVEGPDSRIVALLQRSECAQALSSPIPAPNASVDVRVLRPQRHLRR